MEAELRVKLILFHKLVFERGERINIYYFWPYLFIHRRAMEAELRVKLILFHKLVFERGEGINIYYFWPYLFIHRSAMVAELGLNWYRFKTSWLAGYKYILFLALPLYPQKGHGSRVGVELMSLHHFVCDDLLKGGKLSGVCLELGTHFLYGKYCVSITLRKCMGAVYKVYRVILRKTALVWLRTWYAFFGGGGKDY